MVRINGENENADGILLSDYLREKGFKKEQIAAEINLAIVPKSDYERTVLKDGDTVEILTFVSGG